jgi:hypothetical protein
MMARFVILHSAAAVSVANVSGYFVLSSACDRPKKGAGVTISARRAADGEFLEDEPDLDGLADADLIGEHGARPRIGGRSTRCATPIWCGSSWLKVQRASVVTTLSDAKADLTQERCSFV